MNEWFAVVNPISFLAFLVLTGYIGERTQYVPKIRESLSQIITRITLPVLVVVSLSNQNLSDIPIFNILIVLASGVTAISLLLIINYPLGKLLRVPLERQLIHSFLGSFGNVIFLGYPVILYLFGEIGLLYAIIFSMANELIVWTFGAYLLNSKSQVNAKKWDIKYLFNPNTVSFIIGISMLLLGLRFPSIVNAPLERLGAATTPLSMLFIGSILARTELIKAIKNVSIWSVCLIKMILIPSLFMFGAGLFFPSIQDINIIMLSVIALQMAMPSQTNLSVLADRYNSDPEYAAQTIFVTTLFSAITLPLMYFFCLYIFSKPV
ncbi:MAG: AEC family transporter [Chitinispirillia bacterium]|nr:AEC family transporter [Chitinispirillia bacterium]